MAVTIQRYNHTIKRMWNKEWNPTTFKVMLLDNTATFDGTHTQLSEVAGAGNTKEVSGNGWPVGGVTLSNPAINQVALDDATPNDANLTADDISVNATPGNIGPAYFAVIYDTNDPNDAPGWFIDFDGAQEAGATTDFKIAWAANGIAFSADNPAGVT